MQVPSPIQQLDDPILREAGIQLWIKRDDQIHPHISGNKWRKLKYNIHQAKKEGYQRLLSFGGAYSNHIAALAAGGSIRRTGNNWSDPGREPTKHSKSYLSTLPGTNAACNYIISIERFTETRRIQALQKKWLEEYGPAFLIPEGGTNQWALQGCSELAEEIVQQLSRCIQI